MKTFSLSMTVTKIYKKMFRDHVDSSANWSFDETQFTPEEIGRLLQATTNKLFGCDNDWDVFFGRDKK